MAYLDSADVIRRVKLKLNRPTSDTAFTVSVTDDVLYDFATEEQDEITKLIATYIPDAMVTAPTALVTADAGKTYTLGNDVDSAAFFALGHFSVYSQRSDIPDFPLEPGVDFVVEGTKLRIVNNATRTFPDNGPWAQTVNASNVMASGTQPSIPVVCRMVLVHRTAARGADRLGLDRSQHDADANEAWLTVLAAVRTQARGKGGPPMRGRGLAWRAGRFY